VGIVIFFVSIFFVPPSVSHIWAIAFFGIMTALLFSLFGMLNGLFARKFDDVSIIPTFVLTPLTYLGGVFYDINSLPPFWKNISYLNPLAYAIDGFRYGFSGIARTPVLFSSLALFGAVVVMAVLLMILIRQGAGLKS